MPIVGEEKDSRTIGLVDDFKTIKTNSKSALSQRIRPFKMIRYGRADWSITGSAVRFGGSRVGLFLSTCVKACQTYLVNSKTIRDSFPQQPANPIFALALLFNTI